MKGLRLSSLTGELKKVVAKYNQKPVKTVGCLEKNLGTLGQQWIDLYGGTDATFSNYYHRLPHQALKGFSFDDLCKMKYSTIFMMHETVVKIFERNARYEVIRKIMSSMWRWGAGKGTWNEVVDAYEHIRNFVFTNDPNFEVRLDYSTYHNEFGYAKYSRIFIDGVFAFLVYYKKKHVMTIGFSLMEGRQLLIQQVQSAKCSGNRYLYRLPHNRLEFVVELFRQNFPDYKLHVVDGKSLTQKTLSDYRRGLQNTQERLSRYAAEIKNAVTPSKERIDRYLKESEEDCRVLQEKILHLESDEERIASFYGNAGQFTLGPATHNVNNLVHYGVSS